MAQRRCTVTPCPERGIWKPLPEGMKELPTDHPDSHYSQKHAKDASEISPRSRFNPDGTRRT